MKKDIGLYIHIPFCIKKCLYCDFLSSAANNEIKESYVSALVNEIMQWKDIIKSKYKIKTIFIGGGTPTCLSAKQLLEIGAALSDITENVVEYTIEANPGTINKSHAEAFKQLGINRVSLGLQSANNNELLKLGRIHSYEDFLQSYDLLRKAGINNINIDIMADIPEQTLESYKDTLEKVAALNPEHVSAYSLIVEQGTPFYEMHKSGQLNIADEDTDREMYKATKEILQKHNYNRYEISNYSKSSMECKHNTIYWKAGEYLGIGLGAASYLDGIRFNNESKLDEYIKNNSLNICKCNREQISIKDMAADKENCIVLTKQNKMEEFMFLGLRMCEGVSYNEFYSSFGISMKEVYGDVIKQLLNKKLLKEDVINNRIYLTELGLDVSNYVMSEFIIY